MIAIWRISTLLLITLSLLAVAASPRAYAQEDSRCFAETNQCIAGPIRAYWETNGGLPVFGYPVSAQRTEIVEGRTIQVQWFERDRLEIQTDGTITAGRLGARLLELQWRPWQKFPTGPSDSPSCRFFSETRQSLCGAFQAYWEANGGLERFGYPITPIIDETLEGTTYQVQYFERRRMELHPELSGSPVLLGLLGNQVLYMTGSAFDLPSCIDNLAPVFRSAYQLLTTPETLGCPTLWPPTDMPGSIQRFERGEMIWFDPPDIIIPGGVLGNMIFALGQDAGASFPFYTTYGDTWTEGVDPERVPEQPPAGLYSPVRGFAKVWQQDSALRTRIGWATEPEPQARRADYQIMERGILVRIYEPGTNGTVYAFGGYGLPNMVQRVTP